MIYVLMFIVILLIILFITIKELNRVFKELNNLYKELKELNAKYNEIMYYIDKINNTKLMEQIYNIARHTENKVDTIRKSLIKPEDLITANKKRNSRRKINNNPKS